MGTCQGEVGGNVRAKGGFSSFDIFLKLEIMIFFD